MPSEPMKLRDAVRLMRAFLVSGSDSTGRQWGLPVMGLRPVPDLDWSSHAPPAPCYLLYTSIASPAVVTDFNVARVRRQFESRGGQKRAEDIVHRTSGALGTGESVASTLNHYPADIVRGDDSITEASWYRCATAKPSISAPPLWTLHDTMSSLGMLAFGLPEGGALTAAGIGALNSLLDNMEKRAAFEAKRGEAHNTKESPLQRLENDLKRFYSEQSVPPMSN